MTGTWRTGIPRISSPWPDRFGYLGYEDVDLRPRSVRPDELVVLLRGSWARFEFVTLDPVPGDDAGFMHRLASMHRDDFLDYLVRKHGLGRPAHDKGPWTRRRENHPWVYET